MPGSLGRKRPSRPRFTWPSSASVERRDPGMKDDRRDRLLAVVHGRLRDFLETQDPRAVLGQKSAEEAAALYDLLTEPAEDLTALRAAATVYWCRYRLLPAGQGQRDLRSAVLLMSPVFH